MGPRKYIWQRTELDLFFALGCEHGFRAACRPFKHIPRKELLSKAEELGIFDLLVPPSGPAPDTLHLDADSLAAINELHNRPSDD